MSGPKIEIASAEFRAMKGTSKQGKAYDMAMQDAYVHKGEKYPEKFEVPLQKDGNGNWVPYQPGHYTVTPASYQVRDGRLAVNAFEMQLVGVGAADKVRAA
jgi:hypothetical protein